MAQLERQSALKAESTNGEVLSASELVATRTEFAKLQRVLLPPLPLVQTAIFILVYQKNAA